MKPEIELELKLPELQLEPRFLLELEPGFSLELEPGSSLELEPGLELKLQLRPELQRISSCPSKLPLSFRPGNQANEKL